MFQGEGLPGSQVIARFSDGEARVNVTTVGPDGTCRMEISSQQLGIDGKKSIFFEMDSQVFTFEDSKESDFILSVSSGDDGSSSVMMIIFLVVGAVVLLGIGAYFFIEFEEELLDELTDSEEANREEDPYAWAKKKQYDEVQIPTQTEQQPTVTQDVQQQTSQHPGWIWDAANNQWVPDPNYQPPQ